MKNKIVVFASFLLVVFGAVASTADNLSLTNNYNNGYENSFTFIERGVTFTVFQNGEFDFYINPRNDVHVGYRGNGINISFNSGYNYDTYVQYDYYGAIIQIEDIPIYYDYYGRVDGIGNIDINYNYGRLVSIGRMYIHYNIRGYFTNTSGYINSYNRNYVHHPFHKYFKRPLFDYRIVSYLPYRDHYKPIRYRYYKDHSKNNYYRNNSNKRATNNNSRKRVASHNVPKRTIDRVARVSKTNNTRDYSAPRTDRTSTTRTNTSTRDNTVNSSTRRKTTPSKTNTNRRTVTKKPVVNKQTPVKRKSSRN